MRLDSCVGWLTTAGPDAQNTRRQTIRPTQLAFWQYLRSNTSRRPGVGQIPPPGALRSICLESRGRGPRIHRNSCTAKVPDPEFVVGSGRFSTIPRLRTEFGNAGRRSLRAGLARSPAAPGARPQLHRFETEGRPGRASARPPAKTRLGSRLWSAAGPDTSIRRRPMARVVRGQARPSHSEAVERPRSDHAPAQSRVLAMPVAFTGTRGGPGTRRDTLIGIVRSGRFGGRIGAAILGR
jgi:hypothetical protein